MSAATSESKYRIPADSAWSHAWKIALAVGAVGVLGSAWVATTDLHQFAFSWLFAFITFLAIALGGVFFCLIQFLTSSGWSVAVRRIPEFLLSGLPLFALLFLPIAFAGMEELYPWAAHHAEDHSAPGEHQGESEHGGHSALEGAAHAGQASGTAEHQDSAGHIGGSYPEAEHEAHGEVLAKKTGYLNKPFFYVRAAIYFLVWLLVSWRIFSTSTRQDTTKDPKLTVRLARLAPVGTLAIGLTSTFAIVDWVMSLEPTWFSTIYGVNFFASCIVSLFAITILIALGLRASGLLRDTITTEHYHDLGKLQFGFLVFWAYVNFSQLMLIWYASVPEETTYYHNRWNAGGWRSVGMFILLVHFVVPFFLLLSRNAKRRTPLLGMGAAIILSMHVVYCYWLVMPYVQPDHSFAPHVADLFALLAVGGLYLGLVFNRMTKHPLVAVGDPRLPRSLHFVNH